MVNNLFFENLLGIKKSRKIRSITFFWHYICLTCNSVAIQYYATVESEFPIAALQQKTALLEQLQESKKKEIQSQDDHIDSLKQAMSLIEFKLPATPKPAAQPVVKKLWLFWKK